MILALGFPSPIASRERERELRSKERGERAKYTSDNWKGNLR